MDLINNLASINSSFPIRLGTTTRGLEQWRGLPSQWASSPRSHATLSSVAELGGGLLVAIGFVTPLAAGPVIGMIVAIATVHAPKGLWNTQRGFEYNLVLISVAFAGHGAYSLDAALGWTLAGTDWDVGATSIAVVAAVGALASRRLGHQAHGQAAQH